MNILILGGTVFLGRALVDAALARGHTVTLFNRGKSNPGVFPDVETLTGDRKQDLSALSGRTWEAVIDTSGYIPREARMAAQALSDRVDHYTFISSISVYADQGKPGINEDDPVGKLEDKSVEDVTGETYGPLKALCEQEVQQIFGERALIIRPGLIVGPHDPSDRFTYWPWRVAQGGEVMAPGNPARLVQFIDVRDLAEWNIRLVEAGQGGVYNATGPLPQPTMGELLETCKEVSGSDAELVWVSEEFLAQHEVGPWMEMPLWIPEDSEDAKGMFLADISKPVKAGLTFRPLAETVRATLEWVKTRPVEHTWRAGGIQKREADLLRAWKAAGGPL